ncbi:MAG: hypothetical protein Q7J10_05550 [Methanosarcinaceae archaeon]|nr:hypothetical protein [Methanosarcinaceae archaeon]
MKILDILNIFKTMPTSRIAYFAGISELTAKTKMDELAEFRLVDRSPHSTPNSIQWILSPFGEQIFNEFKEHDYSLFMLTPKDLNTENQSKYEAISQMLKEDWYSFTQIRNTTNTTIKELKLFLRFLEYRGMLEDNLIDGEIKYRLSDLK